MNSLVGQSLGRYHLTEKLGEGGMAMVYKGFDTRLERDVAVKVIRSEFVQFEDFLARFEREAKALAQLTHPNIVHINDFGEHDGLPYLVMDYLPGGTLKEKLDGPMPFQMAIRILLPVARALEYAHEMKIVHRDVKPANILLTKNGQPMLTDFGLAKMLENNGGTNLTSTGVGIGTPDYMAPEQWLGKTCPQTDMYALGVVFYEMITGKRPYTADTPAAVLLKQANEPLPEPGTFVKDIPESVEHFLYKVLAKDPENRFAGMTDFIKAMEKLERMADTLQVETTEEPVIRKKKTADPVSKSDLTRFPEEKSPRKTIFQRPVFWVLLVVLLGGLAFGVWYFWEDIFSGPEEKAETFLPPEMLTTVLADDFEDPLYNDYFNEKIWDFWGGTLISVYQLDGEMHFLAPSAENEGALLVTRDSYNVLKTNYFQAEVNLAYYAKKGFGTASLSISPEDESRWIECQFISDGNELICFEENEAGDQVTFIQDAYFDQDSWYFIQLIIDPRTFQVDVYVEETLLGSYIPEQAEFWKNSSLRFSLGAYVHRTESEFYVDFDNVWVGSQFEGPQVHDENPPMETENTPLVTDNKESQEPDIKYSPVANLEHDLGLDAIIQDVFQVPAVKQELRFVLEENGVMLTSLYYMEPLDVFVRSSLFNIRDLGDENFFNTTPEMTELLQLPQIGDSSISFRGQDVGEGTDFPGLGIRFVKGEIGTEILLMGPLEKLGEEKLMDLAKTIFSSLPQELAETDWIYPPPEGLDQEIFQKYLNSFELGMIIFPEETFVPQASFVSSEEPVCFFIEAKERFQPVNIAIYDKKRETYVYEVLRLMPVVPGYHQACYPAKMDLQPGPYVYRIWLEGSQVVDSPFDVVP